jgi:ubiquinone/menaquinone biosynthesis C-methylase UbiE
MSEKTIPAIQRPRVDDRPIWDILSGIFGYPAVLVSHDLKLFSLLAEKPRTLSEVCDSLGIASRPAEALLTVNSSLGLVRVENDRYSLTSLAEDYLLESSPASFSGYLDLMIASYSTYSVESIKKMVLTNTSQVYSGEDYVKTHEEKAEQARTFTLGMHGLSMGSALAWPDAVDLSGIGLMLDIGGGSGAHSIGAVQRWPDLQATVLDLATVCEVAEEIIKRHGLQSRIKTQVFDYWEDSFPPADLHFYSLSYQNWTLEKCRVLTQKSFESLKPGGRIIIHETLYNDDKTTGPFQAAALNIVLMLWCEGGQYSGQEFAEMLAEAGFTDIEVKPTFGYWSIVTGLKP